MTRHFRGLMVALFGLVLAMGTQAAASTITLQITNQNGGIPGLPANSSSIGTVELALVGGQIQVTVKLIPGTDSFIVPDGNDISFNGFGSTSQINIVGNQLYKSTDGTTFGTPLTYGSLKSNQSIGSSLGSFAVTIFQISGTSKPLYYVQFTVAKNTGSYTNADLLAIAEQANAFAFHLGKCSTSACTNTGSNTGFVGTTAYTPPPPPKVPEPGTLLLMGSGLAGLLGAVRRKLA